MDIWQTSETSHSKSSLGNFQHHYMSELLVNVYRYHLMDTCTYRPLLITCTYIVTYIRTIIHYYCSMSASRVWSWLNYTLESSSAIDRKYCQWESGRICRIIQLIQWTILYCWLVKRCSIDYPCNRKCHVASVSTTDGYSTSSTNRCVLRWYYDCHYNMNTIVTHIHTVPLKCNIACASAITSPCLLVLQGHQFCYFSSLGEWVSKHLNLLVHWHKLSFLEIHDNIYHCTYCC